MSDRPKDVPALKVRLDLRGAKRDAGVAILRCERPKEKTMRLSAGAICIALLVLAGCGGKSESQKSQEAFDKADSSAADYMLLTNEAYIRGYHFCWEQAHGGTSYADTEGLVPIYQQALEEVPGPEEEDEDYRDDEVMGCQQAVDDIDAGHPEPRSP
jgi:hypothetical protein